MATGKFLFWALNASKLLISQNNAEYCTSFYFGMPTLSVHIYLRASQVREACFSLSSLHDFRMSSLDAVDTQP